MGLNLTGLVVVANESLQLSKYLMNIVGYIASEEENAGTLCTAVRSHDSTVSSLHTENTKRDTIFGYQKKHRDERNMKNHQEDRSARD